MPFSGLGYPAIDPAALCHMRQADAQKVQENHGSP
jgi:hypothetical protein